MSIKALKIVQFSLSKTFSISQIHSVFANNNKIYCGSSPVFINKQSFSSNLISTASQVNEKSLSNLTKNDSKINPLQHPDYFGVKSLVTLEDLFNARVHYGHQKGSRNEHMKPYLFGCRLEIDIIDLNQTLVHLHHALNFLAHIAHRNGIILFLTQAQQFGLTVEQLAVDCGEYAHTRPFRIGTFTNSYNKLTKSVRLPDVCVFLSCQGPPYKTHEAVAEANKLGIITVGVCDTNLNPTLISYPIPGNDDTPVAVELYCRLFKEAILLGKEARKQHAKNVSQR